MKNIKSKLKTTIKSMISKLEFYISETDTPKIISKIRAEYFQLQINQRLYINAGIVLILYSASSLILSAKDWESNFFIFLVFWIAAVGYDLIKLIKKFYETIVGKGLLLILASLCTNLSIALSSQLVNGIVGVDPSKFPHTITLLSILSIPLFMAVGFSILFFILLSASPLILMFHLISDDITKEVLIPGYSKNQVIQYQKTTRIIQLISIATFCGFIFSYSQKSIQTYGTFITDIARSFLYNMEMYEKSPCNIDPNSKVAFISEEKILVGQKDKTSIIFTVQDCKK